MPDLGLQSFNKLYPMMIRKYQDLVVDQNASEKDKINSIIQKLNALGKLSNDVVRDWNTVYNWAMNDGLNTDVSNKLEEMRANGEISQLLQNIYDSLVGSMSNLHTNAKDLLVNAINEVDDLAKANQTAITTIQGKQTTDEANIATNTANIATNTANIATNTANIATNTANIASNTSALAQIASNVKSTFSAKGDNTSDDTVALTNALNSNYSTIYLPDGTYKITNTMVINTGIPKKVIGSKNTVISVQLPSSTTVFNLSINVAFENITFDFNNGYVTNALSYGENLGEISLKNLKFNNVRDTDNTTSTTLINIATNGNTVKIDDITFNNLYKKGNGVITDSAGNITAIYLGDRTTSAPVNGSIKNIRITEMHNIDTNGNIIFEDTSGIYPYSAYTGSDGFLSIENVYGFNFGKRLIKTDASNINIRNVYAYSVTNDALAGIGINNTGLTKKKITISNVQIFGNLNNGIANAGYDVVLDGAIIDIQKPNMTGNGVNAFGIFVAGDRMTINNTNITSERNILLNRTDKIIEDLKIANSVLTVPIWGSHNIHVNTGSYGFRNLVVQNVSASNASNSGSTNSFIETATLTGTSLLQKGVGLTILNSSLNYNGTTINDYAFNLNNVDDINISNFTYMNDGVTKAYRGIYATTCKNIKINNFACNAYLQEVIQFSNCDNVRVFGLTSHAADYSVGVYTSTDVKLKDVDRSKVVLGDTQSQQNTLIEAETSNGTTANRPVNAYIDHTHFDTTLGKPVWAKTSAVNELDTLTITTGATTSGNITITLNGVAVTVAVSAGDTTGAIGDKIRGTTFKQWKVGGTIGSSTVTFRKTTGGTNSAPTFADTGTTGTAASFAVTTAGANPTWVDATGTAV